jgi:uncharacterized membrane protein YGL010W
VITKREKDNMFEEFLESYKSKHQHSLNRLTHNIGIPMIVISIPLFFFNWKIAGVLFVVGWMLQFIGHAIEGNQPAFFRNPIFLLIGPLWIIDRLKILLGIRHSNSTKSQIK